MSLSRYVVAVALGCILAPSACVTRHAYIDAGPYPLVAVGATLVPCLIQASTGDNWVTGGELLLHREGVFSLKITVHPVTETTMVLITGVTYWGEYTRDGDTIRLNNKDVPIRGRGTARKGFNVDSVTILSSRPLPLEFGRLRNQKILDVVLAERPRCGSESGNRSQDGP